MKKVMLILFISIFMFMPTMLSAEIESESFIEALESEGIEPLFDKYKEKEDEGTIYLFRTQGDSSCIEFLKYLNSIYEDYGNFFNVKVYEVSKNSDNLQLMNYVIEELGTEVSSTPLILAGDVHFVAYNENVNENILKAIVIMHEAGEDRTDNVENVLNKYYKNEGLIVGVVLSVIVIVVGLIVFASVKDKVKIRK